MQNSSVSLTPVQYSQKPKPLQRNFWGILLVLLLAFGLRMMPYSQNRFHPDEALYAHYAQRIASGQDPWLQGLMVDKPPLLFYVSAVSLSFLGPWQGGEPIKAEFAIRLPSLLASLITVALVYSLGRGIYGQRAAIWATLLLALSPMAILFAVTAFLDPLMVALWVAALFGAWRGRWGAAGLLLGLAIATKQTALIGLPLVMALGLLSPQWRWQVRPMLWFGLGIGLPVLLSFGWDTYRAADFGFWVQGVNQNLPRRLIRSHELLPRWRAWVGWLATASGAPLVNLVALVGSFGLAGRALLRPAVRQNAVDLLLLGFILCYLALYWLLAFATWDRYLLLLLPLLALLAGRGIDGLFQQLVRWHIALPRAFAGGLLLLLAWPSWQAAAYSAFPVGGDHGAYDGIDQVAAYFASVPPGSVVYDYWLSWPLRFYLFDAQVLVSWQPDPATLAQDLSAFGGQDLRYMVVPSWAAFDEFARAMASVGYIPTERLTTTGRTGQTTFTIYELLPHTP